MINAFVPVEFETSQQYIDANEACLLIADDTVLSKTYSEKIDFVNYQYSGNTHNVIAGIGLINLLWHGLEQKISVSLDSCNGRTLVYRGLSSRIKATLWY